MVWTARRAMLVLVACNVLWAGTYVAGKTALGSISPVELNCLRFGIAGLVFLPALWRRRHSFSPGRAELRQLALLCLLGFVLNKAAEFSGLKLTTASDTALLISSEGVFTAILGWLLLREPVRRTAVLGLSLSVIGVYLVVARGLVWPGVGGGMRIIGDLLVVLALVFEALYSVLGKAELARNSALFITAACVIGSLAVWIPAAAVNVAAAGLPHITAQAWIGIMYLALAGTVIAYVGWIAALGHVDAAAAAPTLLLQPLLGALLAVWLLGERLSWGTLAGGALIITGIWVARARQESLESISAPNTL